MRHSSPKTKSRTKPSTEMSMSIGRHSMAITDPVWFIDDEIAQPFRVDLPQSGIREGMTDRQDFGEGKPQTSIVRYQTDPHSGHTFYSLFLPNLDDWPTDLDLPSERFILLMVTDCRDIPDQALKDFARRAIAQGAVYLCAWGPKCRRVELAFDLAASEQEETDDTVLMTTSHDNEPLDEALWFFEYCAHPADAYFDEATSNLAVVIGDEAWYTQVCRRLNGLASLNEDSENPEHD